MKIIQEKLNKANPIIAELKLPSRTKKGVEYLVQLRKDGTIACGCEAAQFKPTCSHREEAKKIWDKDFGWMWKL